MTKFLATPGSPGRSDADDRFGEIEASLSRHQPVVIPTDTVYGLAASLDSPAALKRIFTLKGRPREVALPVLVSGLAQLPSLGVDLEGHDPGRALLEAFWPGPLTVVISTTNAALAARLGSQDATIGVRQPAHPFVQVMCTRFGPLAVTSANRHGEPPWTTAAQAEVAFPGTLVIEGGICDGVPSTVVDCSIWPPTCRRSGAISWEKIVGALGSKEPN